MHTRTHVWEGAVDLQSLRSIACVLTKFRKPTELQSSMTTTTSWKYQMSMPLTGPRDWDWVGVSDSAGQADDLSDRAANCSAINYRFHTLPWKKRWPDLHCHDLRLIRSHLCSALHESPQFPVFFGLTFVDLAQQQLQPAEVACLVADAYVSAHAVGWMTSPRDELNLEGVVVVVVASWDDLEISRNKSTMKCRLREESLRHFLGATLINF